MIVYFRESRSTIQEALKTEKKFVSFEHLIDFLEDKYILENDIIIHYYTFDDRLGVGTTFIVTDGLWNDEDYGGVLGFAYLRDNLSQK